MPPRKSKRLKTTSSPPNSNRLPLSANNTIQASFFDIFSPEIRNEVYRHLVVKPQGQPLRCPPVKKLLKRMEDHETSRALLKPSRGILAFAGTCLQAHNEVTAIYYGENEFGFEGFWEMQVFMYMIGSHNRQCLQNVVVVWAGSNASIAKDAAALLGECKKMKNLEIRTANPASTIGGQGNDLFKGPRSRVLGLIRGLVDVKLKVRRDWSRCPWWFTEKHVREFEEWLQEKMRIDEESELVFKDEFEKEEEAKREEEAREARKRQGEQERNRKKKQLKGSSTNKVK